MCLHSARRMSDCQTVPVVHRRGKVHGQATRRAYVNRRRAGLAELLPSVLASRLSSCKPGQRPAGPPLKADTHEARDSQAPQRGWPPLWVATL